MINTRKRKKLADFQKSSSETCSQYLQCHSKDYSKNSKNGKKRVRHGSDPVKKNEHKYQVPLKHDKEDMASSKSPIVDNPTNPNVPESPTKLQSASVFSKENYEELVTLRSFDVPAVMEWIHEMLEIEGYAGKKAGSEFKMTEFKRKLDEIRKTVVIEDNKTVHKQLNKRICEGAISIVEMMGSYQSPVGTTVYYAMKLYPDSMILCSGPHYIFECRLSRKKVVIPINIKSEFKKYFKLLDARSLNSQDIATRNYDFESKMQLQELLIHVVGFMEALVIIILRNGHREDISDDQKLLHAITEFSQITVCNSTGTLKYPYQVTEMIVEREDPSKELEMLITCLELSCTTSYAVIKDSLPNMVRLSKHLRRKASTKDDSSPKLLEPKYLRGDVDSVSHVICFNFCQQVLLLLEKNGMKVELEEDEVKVFQSLSTLLSFLSSNFDRKEITLTPNKIHSFREKWNKPKAPGSRVKEKGNPDSGDVSDDEDESPRPNAMKKAISLTRDDLVRSADVLEWEDPTVCDSIIFISQLFAAINPYHRVFHSHEGKPCNSTSYHNDRWKMFKGDVESMANSDIFPAPFQPSSSSSQVRAESIFNIFLRTFRKFVGERILCERLCDLKEGPISTMTRPTGESVEVRSAADILRFEVAPSEVGVRNMRYWCIQQDEEKATGICFLGFGSFIPRDAPIISTVNVTCTSSDRACFGRIRGQTNPIHFKLFDVVRLSLPTEQYYIGVIVEEPEVVKRYNGLEEWKSKIYFNDHDGSFQSSVESVLQSNQDFFMYKLADLNIQQEIYEHSAMMHFQKAPLELKLAYTSPVEYYRNVNSKMEWILKEISFRNILGNNRRSNLLTNEQIFHSSLQKIDSYIQEKELSLQVPLNNHQRDVLIHGSMFKDITSTMMHDKERRERLFNSTPNVQSGCWGTTINFVHGPPGSGKSNIAKFLVRNTLSEKERVLVLSITNDAVDDLIEKVFKGWSRFSTENALRVGSNSSRPIGRQNELRKLAKERKTSLTSMINERCLIYGTINAVINIKDWSQVSAFQTIIIEECAYAEPSLVFTTLAMVTRKTTGNNILGPRVFLIGDYRQLPIYRSQGLKQITQKPFVGFLEQGASFQLPTDYPSWTIIPSHQLWSQYRMNSKICSLVSDLFYDGKLKCAIPDEERAWTKQKVLEDAFRSSSQCQPITVVDHSKFIGQYRHQAYNGEMRNYREAKLVHAILRNLKIANEKLTENVLVLTSYNAQVSVLKEVLREFDNINVKTINSSQGEEYDVVVLSLVKADKEYSVNFLNDAQEACTAMSRSKELLIIVGAVMTISERSPLWKSIVNWLKRRTGEINRRSSYGVAALRPASITSDTLININQYYRKRNT